MATPSTYLASGEVVLVDLTPATVQCGVPLASVVVGWLASFGNPEGARTDFVIAAAVLFSLFLFFGGGGQK